MDAKTEREVQVIELREKFDGLSPVMDERMRRIWAATEAKAIGYGGIRRVCEATGIAKMTVLAGLRDLAAGPDAMVDVVKVRRRGGGRKPLTHADPGLVRALEDLVAPHTRGDPQSALRWTSKSVNHLAEELARRRHPVSPRTVSTLLKAARYSLQANSKSREGANHPDRDRQFRHINERVNAFQRRGQPVVSVDTKKKELVGDYKNGGREWQPKGKPIRVQMHDFPDPKVPKAIPYGVYDVSANKGWVNVGTDHDTPAFAVESLRQWWRQMGRRTYPTARELLVTADAGGSNGYRARAWKASLQRFANDTGLRVTACHLPPGTSKWNKIEHRMFCHITQNWRGRPLVSYETIVNLIATTRTRAGLRIRAKLDPARYPKGQKVSNAEMAAINLRPHRFHGEWNYVIEPTR